MENPDGRISYFNMFEEIKLNSVNLGLVTFDFKHDIPLQLTRNYNIMRDMMEEFGEMLLENIDDLTHTYAVIKLVKGNNMNFDNGEIISERDEIDRRAKFNEKKKKIDLKISREHRKRCKEMIRNNLDLDKRSTRHDDEANSKHLKETFHPNGCLETIRRQAEKLKEAKKELEEMNEKLTHMSVKCDEMRQENQEYLKIKPRIKNIFRTMNYQFNEFTNGVWKMHIGDNLNFDDIFYQLESFKVIRMNDPDMNKSFGHYTYSQIDETHFRDYDVDYDDEDFEQEYGDGYENYLAEND